MTLPEVQLHTCGEAKHLNWHFDIGERVFPDGRELVAHKREQKEETGELQDIKEAIGFPMAPNPSGLSIQDVDDDLKLLGIKHS